MYSIRFSNGAARSVHLALRVCMSQRYRHRTFFLPEVLYLLESVMPFGLGSPLGLTEPEASWSIYIRLDGQRSKER